jgi:hypothetical protein
VRSEGEGSYSLKNDVELVWVQEQRVLQHDDEDMEILRGVERAFLQVVRHQQQGAAECTENLRFCHVVCQRKRRVGKPAHYSSRKSTRKTFAQSPGRDRWVRQRRERRVAMIGSGSLGRSN